MYMIAACTRALGCTDQQLDVLLEGTGIESRHLLQPNGVLPRDREIRFYQNLLRQFPEPGLGLRLGARIRPQELGPIGFAAVTSRSIIESIECSRRYMDLVLPYLRWDLVIGERALVHRISELSETPRELRVFLVELVLSILKFHGQEQLGASCVPARVGVCHADPGYVGLYRRTFAAPVQFRQAANELRYSKHYLDIALPKSDPLTRQTMEALCQRMAANLALKSDIVGDVVAGCASLRAVCGASCSSTGAASAAWSTKFACARRKKACATPAAASGKSRNTVVSPNCAASIAPFIAGPVAPLPSGAEWFEPDFKAGFLFSSH